MRMTKNNKFEETKNPYLALKAFFILNNIEQKEIEELLLIDNRILSKKIDGYAEFTFDEVKLICDTYDISSEIFSRNSKFKISKIKE